MDIVLNLALRLFLFLQYRSFTRGTLSNEMSEEAEPMNGEDEASPPEQSSDTAPPASADTTPPAPPENPYADEKEWGEDITSDKDGGLFKRLLKEGSGDETPMVDDKVYVHYTGRLLDGTVFDSSLERDEPFNFTLGQGNNKILHGFDTAYQYWCWQ